MRVAVFAALAVSALPASGEEPVLSLHATLAAGATGGLTVTLFRWSTDGERAPVLAALTAPPPAPPATAGAAAGRAAGRGGRAGGRGTAAPAPPASPGVRLSAAIKAAPTLGYIWGDGVTGYSIKYAWRSPASTVVGRGLSPADRIVLVTDRRLGAHAPQWDLPSGGAPDAEFTLIEMRLASGVGEAKTSLSANVSVDAAANTLALDGYAAAPAQFRITR